MIKRGKVLRDALAGPGLLIVEGRQYQFLLEGIWRADIPPRPGMAVDIQFDTQGKITGLLPIAECELSQEQAVDTIDANKARTLAPVFAQFVQSGSAQVIAAALLIASWYLLTAISVEAPLTGVLDLTLWQLLRHLGPATYSFLAIVAIAGPFVHHLWKRRPAALGGLLPLSFLLLITAVLFRNVDLLLASGGDRLYQQMPRQAREGLMDSISVGLGSYMSIFISAYFAFVSVKHFRESKDNKGEEVGQLQKAAA